MTGNLQPLDSKFAIVDAQGRPTLYFTKWAQQKQLDIQGSATEAEVQAKVSKAGDTMTGELIINMGLLKPQPFSGQAPGLLIASPSGQQARMVLDGYGAGSAPHYYGRMARLSGTTLSAIQTSDPICQFSGIGYGATAYSSGPRGQLRFQAAENWTDTAQGTRLLFQVTPNGSTAMTLGLSIENDLTAIFYGPAQLKSYATSSLPAAGTAGRLAFDSTTKTPKYDDGAAWQPMSGGGGGGGGATTPTVRGFTACQSSSWQNYNVAFPAGTAVGDVIVAFQENGYGPGAIPAGWTQLSLMNSGWTNGYAVGKVMTAADIATGYVTLNASGNYNGVTCCICITGTTVKALDQVLTYGSGGSGSVGSVGIQGLVGAVPTDLLIGFIASRGAMNIATSAGLTILSSVNGANASGVLVQGTATALGVFGLNESATFPAGNNGAIFSMVTFK